MSELDRVERDEALEVLAAAEARVRELEQALADAMASHAAMVEQGAKLEQALAAAEARVKELETELAASYKFRAEHVDELLRQENARLTAEVERLRQAAEAAKGGESDATE